MMNEKPNFEMIAECLHDYANLLGDGEIDGAGRYLPDNIDEQADLIAALREHADTKPAMSVRVKGLEFVYDGGVWTADSQNYEIWPEGQLWAACFTSVKFDTLEAAQAAAQQDYEARILSTLEPVQAEAVAAQRKAFERLDAALCNFTNAYGGPFEPVADYEAETERNVKELSEAYNEAYRFLRNTAPLSALQEENARLRSEEQRHTAVGMIMAASKIMRTWGAETMATEILNSVGVKTLPDLEALGVEPFDIGPLLPLLEASNV